MSQTLLALVALAGLVVAVASGLAGGVLLAEVRAQDAADAAALAAAHAIRTGEDATVVARRVAAAHGAVLVACDCRGATVTVSVQVEVPTRAAQFAGLRSRRATAHARLVAADRRRTTSADDHDLARFEGLDWTVASGRDDPSRWFQRRKLSRSLRRAAPLTRCP